MRDRIFGHMRSNLVGYVALFVALGGGAYAAAKIDAGDIERNAVRSKHIKKGQVKPPDVKDDSLGGQDVDESKLDPTTAAAFDDVETPVTLSSFDTVVMETDIDVPLRSTLLATASLGYDGNGGDDDRPRCSLTDEGQTLSATYRESVPDTADEEAGMSLSGARAAAPGIHAIDVHCDVASGGAATVDVGNLVVWTVPD